MIEIRQTRRYEEWFGALRDQRTKARINVRIRRLSLGHEGDGKSVGVRELRIDHGPGYRVYFTRIGQQIVILLCGGDKGSQDRDISEAKKLTKALKEDQ